MHNTHNPCPSVAPPGPLSTTAGNLAPRCPNHDHVRLSALPVIPRRITGELYRPPVFLRKTQTPRYLPARYHTSNVDYRLRRLAQEWPLPAQAAGRWPNYIACQNQFEPSANPDEVSN